MKKFIFIMPLMAISLLASCGGGDNPGPAPSTYTITIKAGEEGKFPSGVTELALKVEPNSNLLEDLSNIAEPTYIGTTLCQTFDAFTYDDGNPIGNDDKVSSDDIVVKGTYRNKTLEECKWSEINSISEAGLADKFFKVGDTKKVEVNQKDHDVRIIGFNHDVLKSDKTKTAGITFEFANVITNSDGNADTTYWNNKDEYSSTNYKYSKSTLNDYLNKDANCIFNKLPDELKADGIIKEVYKPVAEAEEPQSGEDPIYEINDKYTTKLFPLSYREITASGDSKFVKIEGSAYPFYTGKGYDTDDNRIKRKAGIETGNGENYWLRSPYTNRSSNAWYVYTDGSLSSYFVYNLAFAVAPAFCI